MESVYQQSKVKIQLTAFSSNIDLEVLDTESGLKVLEESKEILGKLFLGLGLDFTGTEACADWKFYPKHVGESDPRMLVDMRSCTIVLPDVTAIFLEEA